MSPLRTRSETAAGPRVDIQALRALAVSLVVVYHFWPGGLTGGYVGVDVFFVISGFLITTHLLDRVPGGLRDLGEFWGRRIRRLLPAALTVIAATLAATWWIAPATIWDGTARQSVASAFYVQNWLLARDSVDYLAADDAATPVQHFWSLSVEEQFYLGWPVLILLVGLVARRRGMSLRRAAAVTMTLVVAASLACSVLLTDASSYFVTYTRVWELGAGGLVAVAAPVLARLPQGVRLGLVWLGLALVVYAALVFDAATLFPGSAALVPVVGAALIVVADVRRGPLSPLWAMGRRPVQTLGDLSYSIYLWHWPLVILLPYAIGGPAPGAVKLLALCAVVLAAWATKVYVEDPLRGRRPLGLPLRRSFVFALAGSLIIGTCGFALHRESEAQTRQVAAPSPAEDPCYASAALADDSCSPHGSGDLYLPPLAAVEDKSSLFDRGCVLQMDDTSRKTCTFGSDAPDATPVALVGNSHAAMWAPALEKVARERNWRVTTYLMYECYTVDRPVSLPKAGATQACADWNRYVIDRVAAGEDRLVVVSNRYYRTMAAADGQQRASLALARKSSARVLERWSGAGKNVLVVKDPPTPPTPNTPDCVAANPSRLGACDGTVAETASPDPMVAVARDLRPQGVTVLDTAADFCRDGRCYATIGGVVAYYDQSHVTTTYAKSLADRIDAAATTATGS
ncbi:peptidoglycan/LPS O-acetylase OafA/YrhL [Nocardioides albertanoniae]|uniref:Peptidoglycan/LPS O-acetylase OafA/YrhL n=1 Tax=Nocardioides albertanoniae TaxID=1175486 RepID=A0A543AA32_9ACTN|nr:acyltransferase family protein [Nocardioides albertanoniae]TQL69435.1 peptidoglycan/LPS O-acetylase OafA/YrhL [Nocardioides albertanoniae]